MKRVAFVNIKGGTGKTTLANELAFSLDRTGTPYDYYDMDGQRGGAHTETQNDDAEIAIADSAASVSTEELEKVAKAADVVVIPTRSGGLDLHSFAETLNTVRTANPSAAVIIVHNGWNRFTLAKDYSQWLEKHADDAVILALPQSEAVAQASTMKVSVQQQSKRSSGARSMRVVTDAIRAALGLEKEYSDSGEE